MTFRCNLGVEPVPTNRRSTTLAHALSGAPPARRQSNPQFASTLERGLRVLQCFSANAPHLGNADIAGMTGLPKPTVSRLTFTLIELGYLRRCSESARFELASGVLCLGYPVLARLEFRRAAMPHLKSLAEGIDGTAAVSVRDRLRMVTLETYAHRDVFRRRPGIGLPLNLIESTPGLAWLVGARADERDRALREVAHDAPEHLVRLQGEISAGRQQLARHGYVVRRGHIRPETAGLSTPLRRRPGEELVILACAVRTPGKQADAVMRRSGERLLETARRISADVLGV